MVDDIISNLDTSSEKDPIVSKSMGAYWLENSDELLTDVIHKAAVTVSETGEVIKTVPTLESASDTTILTPQSDSDSDPEIVIVQKKRSLNELMASLLI